jgi:putative PIN family toxin of toxin-antitoxin system
LLVSEATIAELDDVLRRPKFDSYLAEYLRLEFLGALLGFAKVVAVDVDIVACRDPRDDKFLSVAVSGRATHIVTGDGDLLALHPFRDVDIVTPQDFLVQIGPAASQ